MTAPPTNSTLDDDNSHLTERVLRDLREQIVSGQLPPGSKLPIRELGARLGASAIPVREALRALHAQGLVDLSTYRVAVVAPVSVEDLEGIYLVRADLEALATRQAAIRGNAAWLSSVEEALHALEALYSTHGADLEWQVLETAHKRFHESIYEASGSKWLLQCIALLRDASDRYHRLIGPAQNMLRGGLEDHQHIVRWLADGEPELASVLVRRHVERTGTTLRRILVTQLAPQPPMERVANGRLSPGRKDGRSVTTSRRGHAEFDSPLQELHPREVAVLAAVAEGKSDAAIAAALDWPLYRVERTLETVFTKLGLADAADVDRRVAAALIYLHGRSPTS